METENFNAAEKETAEVIQCPYKRMKLEAECDSQKGEEALVAVTSLENIKDLSSNGGDDGEAQKADTSDEFVGDVEALEDGDSENGKCAST